MEKIKVQKITFEENGTTVNLPFEVDIDNPDGKKTEQVILEVMAELIKGFINRYETNSTDRGGIVDEWFDKSKVGECMK